MKRLRNLLPVMLVAAITLSACGANPDQNAKSVNVDSTNVEGTAPVRYGADNPADTTPMMEPGDDTGRRANTEQR